MAGSSHAVPLCFLLCLSWQGVGSEGSSSRPWWDRPVVVGWQCPADSEGHAAKMLSLPGDTWQSPQALSALVICFSPPADILCKYAKQKLPLVQEGLNLLSRGVSAIRSSAHHHEEPTAASDLPPPRWHGSALGQNSLSLSSCAVSEPQMDVSVHTKAHCAPKGWLLWHRDKMKSKDSTFVSDSSFPC